MSDRFEAILAMVTDFLGEYTPLAAKKDEDQDKKLKDQKRRERLAFVSMSLSNILPERKKERTAVYRDSVLCTLKCIFLS